MLLGFRNQVYLNSFWTDKHKHVSYKHHQLLIFVCVCGGPPSISSPFNLSKRRHISYEGDKAYTCVLTDYLYARTLVTTAQTLGQRVPAPRSPSAIPRQ